MNFELSHEHAMLKELVGKFVRDQLMPLEATVIARENIGRGTYLNPEETAKVDAVSRELGLWGLDAPEEVGGMNLPMVAMVGVSEELGKTVVPYYLPPDSPNLRMLMISAAPRAPAGTIAACVVAKAGTQAPANTPSTRTETTKAPSDVTPLRSMRAVTRLTNPCRAMPATSNRRGSNRSVIGPLARPPRARPTAKTAAATPMPSASPVSSVV